MQMEPEPQEQPTTTAAVASQQIAKLNSSIDGGASWFYWIAALSLVNSAIILFKGNLSFIVGLGMTQVVDSVAMGVAQEAGEGAAPMIRGVALAVNVAIAAVFVLFGWLAKKRFGAAFIIGMIVYALDGLLFLLVPDWLSIGFHVFVLFCIGSGYSSLRKLAEIQWAATESA